MAIVLFYFIELCGLYFLSLSALFACLSDFIFPLMPPYTVCSRGVGRLTCSLAAVEVCALDASSLPHPHQMQTFLWCSLLLRGISEHL